MLAGDLGSKQVLMMDLAGETFALDARIVREILDPVPVTRVPGAKRYADSVLNVRGRIIPLADLRRRFGMEAAVASKDTRFIVIEAEIDGEPTTVGIIADKVHEVTELDPASLHATPPVGVRWHPDFISAIGKWNDDFIVIPNLTQIFQ